MTRALALASLLGGAGCLVAPAAPHANPDANPDANPPDPTLCLESTDRLGPVAVVSEDGSDHDTIVRAGFHAGVPVLWRFAPGTTTLRCAHQRVILQPDLIDTEPIENLAIATGLLPGTQIAEAHIFVMVARQSKNAYVHDFTVAASGALTEVGMVGSTAGAGTLIHTADPSPFDLTPNFVGYVANRGDVWFGGGTRLTVVRPPFNHGMVAAPDLVTGTDLLYGVESGPGGSQIAILEGAIRHDHADYNNGLVFSNPPVKAFDDSCVADATACTGRVTHALAHPLEGAGILAYSVRAAHVATLPSLAVSTATDLVQYSLVDTVGDVAQVVDVELSEIDDARILFVLWQVPGGDVQLWRYLLPLPDPGLDLRGRGMRVPISSTTAKHLAAVRAGMQSRLLLLGNDPTAPDECLVFDGQGDSMTCS